jgi:hypothetical protein
VNESAERYEAGLTSDLDDDNEPERETRRRPRIVYYGLVPSPRYYACSDRMCGATDCLTCYPGNHDEEAE